MKSFFKTTLFIITLVSLTLYSCGDTETNPDEENPTTGDCMEFVEIGNSKIIYLQFVDDNNGWAIGIDSDSSHDLLNTSDAGATWQIVNEDFEMSYDNGYVAGEGIYFINATHGFKYIHHYDANLLSMEYTTDKGVTWNTLETPFRDVYGNPISVDGLVKTISSNGTETLFLYRNAVLKIDNMMNITFNHLYDLDAYPVKIETNSSGSYYYATDGTITAVVSLPNDNSGDMKMAQSTDNGATWTITSDVLDGDNFISSSWVNNSVGYVAVGYYSGAKNLYKTTDGGATWTVLNEPPNFQMIRFADENNGIGVTDFDFFYTTDGGNSWTEIEVCKNSDGQYIMGYDEVLAYPSVNNGWVAGSKYHDDFINSDTGVFNFKGE